MVLNWIDQAPRRVLALISVACVAMLAFGMYLQHVVGLEPCPMCAGAAFWTRIGRVVYGAKDEKRGHSKFDGNLTMLHPKTTCQGGLLAEESAALLSAFFRAKRK